MRRRRAKQPLHAPPDTSSIDSGATGAYEQAMPVNARDASVAVFVRGLTQLKALLTKGEAHASERAMDPGELLHAQLAHDMYDLATQAAWAAEGARAAVNRLAGVTASPAATAAGSFAELHERLDATVAYLESQSLEDLEAGLERAITLEHRGTSTTFVGSRFLLEFALPSFFFHLTTAYGILRHKGVQVTKGDFLGMARDP